MGFIQDRLTANVTLRLGVSTEYGMRGLIANRPAADEVDAGTTYWAVDRITETDEFSVSNGTNWTNF